ncbi:hypothetical protein [Rathayibacter sp. AY1A7]|uniref:hypothetical protein n=1 Tax=Rathayibacter sp. AY1A7 TaxID=2080524 RepID=UPI000CE8C287|nr:hypothetical protein [Rathayibacter sp. AY1A7]PPF21018.1 hypothetical protein C5B95_06295 [Rathayibacter sp. AY1A7]
MTDTTERPAHSGADRPDYGTFTLASDLRLTAEEYESEEKGTSTWEEREVYRKTAAKLRLVALLVTNCTWSSSVGVAFLEAARDNLLAVHLGRAVEAKALMDDRRVARDSASLPTQGVTL